MRPVDRFSVRLLLAAFALAVALPSAAAAAPAPVRHGTKTRALTTTERLRVTRTSPGRRLTGLTASRRPQQAVPRRVPRAWRRAASHRQAGLHSPDTAAPPALSATLNQQGLTAPEFDVAQAAGAIGPGSPSRSPRPITEWSKGHRSLRLRHVPVTRRFRVHAKAPSSRRGRP